MEHDNLYKDIKDILTSRTPQSIQAENRSFIHAAVLIPLFREDGEYKVLFTKRTNRVEHHKDQISFPGGVVDTEDNTFEETALREAYEEIGLLREDVTVLGKIDDKFTVVSNFVVHPFVGHIPHPYDFRINPTEVKRIIRAPLKLFFGDIPSNESPNIEFEGATYPTPAYMVNSDLIWGATARIMENFVAIIGEKLSLYVKSE